MDEERHLSEGVQSAFKRLQPICAALAQEHSRKNVILLHRVIQETDPLFINELQEYVLFPLRLIVKKSETR